MGNEMGFELFNSSLCLIGKASTQEIPPGAVTARVVAGLAGGNRVAGNQFAELGDRDQVVGNDTPVRIRRRTATVDATMPEFGLDARPFP
ncbi:hypothetical protein CYJ10_21580 [Cupriavidus pauculus]|uniref:Uncharacterized protein n=1 Tax=Cupriavidus pauculus TaxID=82633 RepID=A0A2N5C8F8_9BURK|nr:hypothetical protein CYJ10_21580 [Cupriavidus pauculus]